ncbi:sporulation peptidase YabG [Tenuibacillus multivorans]|uniref:Spore coat assemly protein n=1 Tax=Tenuibacillus multivorans TaxID=237069 RepID=A0A1G9W0C9_9BACI|nr:sporulation peptidase YabG [Tenuibacillus multivorans]GEL78267.1 sporulation peptidase YabG [Tenuibacillus multivorans]SDM77972.1 spore coat assemly protein [Tenuibacillus multivorans]
MKWHKGDIVSRRSYNHDLLFRVQEVNKEQAILFGEDFRLKVDAPLDDLKRVTESDRFLRKKEMKKNEDLSYRMFRQDYYLRSFRDYTQPTSEKEQSISQFRICPKVLHIDGDSLFLKKCIQLYKRLGLQVHGIHVDEIEMPEKIKVLMEKVQPDILVITGHDSFSKQKGDQHDIRAYRNSKYFVEAVREARRIIPSLDQLVIFAGACQSHFESLIKAGANFASSPTRINIHALDPVYVVAKVGYTPFMEKVDIFDVVSKTITRERGIGGIETSGFFRVGLPYMKELPMTNEKSKDE